MNPIPINVAVEDLLSESVSNRLIRESGGKFSMGTTFGRSGYGYLRKTIRGWNAAARSRPIFVLTDLDDEECPASLTAAWLGCAPHPNLLFRVAVREVEAWLLADREALASFLSVPKRFLRSAPAGHPESFADPKATLIELCRHSSSREIKQRIVPAAGSTAQIGREYNACLAEFVETVWRPGEARKHAVSLDRALRRLEHFAPTW